MSNDWIDYVVWGAGSVIVFALGVLVGMSL